MRVRKEQDGTISWIFETPDGGVEEINLLRELKIDSEGFSQRSDEQSIYGVGA